MKNIFKGVLAISCTAMSLFGLSACGSESAVKPQSTVLGSPTDITVIAPADRQTEKVKTIAESAEEFAADFASIAYKAYEDNENFAVAPVSVYMALSLAAQCADGNTRSEILSTLGVTYDQLVSGFSDYYRSLFAEYKSDGKVTGTITFSNSVWLDNRMRAKQECIDTLADKFNSYSYNAGFYEDNEAANLAVREFVKDKTRGLIDKDFKLSKDTLFALINTLYIKDIWNDFGQDLSYTKAYDFVNYDETKTNTKLLQGYYRSGRVYEGENYRTFFTSTYNGNKIKFILPKEGFSVNDIFNDKNLYYVNSIKDYKSIDEANKIRYNTRCLFPEFSAEYYKEIDGFLKSMGIKDMFSNVHCNYSTITDDDAYCSKVIHTTKLKVDKSGMEGAAVTIIANDAASAPPEREYEEVYEDFIIDKSFGFILTDRYDNTLFSGVVKKV